MNIESIIRRKNGTRVDLDDQSYHFKPSENDERHLCEVEIKEHIQRFLSIPEGFQPAELSEAVAAAIEPAPTTPAAPVQQDTAPVVTDQPVLGTLAGVVENDGTVTSLPELPRDQLLILARDMEIENVDSMTDEELAEAIRAEPVELDGDEDQANTDPGANAVDGNNDGAPTQELSRDRLVELYEAKFGKKPHHKLSAERIQQIIAEEDE